METVSSATSASFTGESSTASMLVTPASKTSCAGVAVTAPGSLLRTATVTEPVGLTLRRAK